MERPHSRNTDYHAQSGWLHNVITSKHAEGMAALEMMDFNGKDSVRKKIEESISAY